MGWALFLGLGPLVGSKNMKVSEYKNIFENETHSGSNKNASC